MVSLRTLIIFIIYAAVLFFGHRLEKQLSRHNNARPGLILPVVAVIVAAVLSFRNFWIAWDVKFGLFAFLAAVVLFVFYAVPAIYFILLYMEGRQEVRSKRMTRSVRARQVKTQQRYESPLVKQEPIIYMPDQKTSTPNVRAPRKTASTTSRPNNNQTSRKKRNRSSNTRKR